MLHPHRIWQKLKILVYEIWKVPERCVQLRGIYQIFVKHALILVYQKSLLEHVDWYISRVGLHFTYNDNFIDQDAYNDSKIFDASKYHLASFYRLVFLYF